MMNPEQNDELERSPVARTNGEAHANTRVERKLPPAVGGLGWDQAEAKISALEGDARAVLSSEQVAEIRRRIRDGAYNTVEIADRVAQRLLESGDLDASDD